MDILIIMKVKEKNNITLLMIKALLAALFFMLPLMPRDVYAADAKAAELEINITAANNESTSKLKDGSYSTSITFTPDNTLTITPVDSEEKIYGLYIVWASRPGQWRLSYNGSDSVCGQNAFLHEYAAIEQGTGQAVITLSQNEKICYIKAYSEGELPDDVQVWKPECDKADIMLFSTHADDEILFFGGVLAEYAGERKLNVQIVYFSNYFGGTVIREHEKLDGLWASGVRSYPVNGDFPDQYADNLEEAVKIYGYDEALSFIVEQIRRFRPQVCIAQDTNGEYGHGTHMLTSAVMQEAVNISMQPDSFPESAAQYGVWDVPKTYIHLYGENKISLDCRKPLEAFNGQTALEVAEQAYKKHVSQQWCWFYVSDTYQYSIADFGLYRTTVGADAGNDMMENLVSYEQQQRIADEKKAEEEASRQAEIEAREAEEASKAKAEYENRFGVSKEDVPPDKVSNFVKTVGITLIIMVASAIVILAIGSAVDRAKRKRKRRRHR